MIRKCRLTKNVWQMFVAHRTHRLKFKKFYQKVKVYLLLLLIFVCLKDALVIWPVVCMSQSYSSDYCFPCWFGQSLLSPFSILASLEFSCSCSLLEDCPFHALFNNSGSTLWVVFHWTCFVSLTMWIDCPNLVAFFHMGFSLCHLKVHYVCVSWS